MGFGRLIKLSVRIQVLVVIVTTLFFNNFVLGGSVSCTHRCFIVLLWISFFYELVSSNQPVKTGPDHFSGFLLKKTAGFYWFCEPCVPPPYIEVETHQLQ
jgi:hypothetical protein